MGTEMQVKNFEENFKDLPTNMRILSLSLRSLYTTNHVGSGEEFNRFRELRDGVRRDAAWYTKGILPLALTAVRHLDDYFEYYVALDQDEWEECLDDILIDVTSYKNVCKEVVKLHEPIQQSLKKKESRAKVLVKEFDTLTQRYEEKKRKLEASAENKKKWAVGLSFIPFVGQIAGPILSSQASAELAEAAAAQTQSELAVAAIHLVKDTLLTALEKFIAGVDSVAGFFFVMEQNLESIRSRGETARGEPKKLHYKVMRSKARRCLGLCQNFVGMIPAVMTDLQCVPYSRNDDNFVQQWLVKTKKEIKQKYERQRQLKGGMKKLIADMEKAKNKL